jgi:hypothetical protein
MGLKELWIPGEGAASDGSANSVVMPLLEKEV